MCVACNHTIHRKNHNFAWSRDFTPALTCKPGETIHFECLDAGWMIMNYATKAANQSGSVTCAYRYGNT